jgi:hypothetical protein
MNRNVLTRVLATALIFAVPGLFIPARAADQPATLAGAIVTVGDQTPLTGAKLHIANPITGELMSSSATGADGTYRIENVPPGTYELGVEAADRLYLVEAPFELAPGQVQGMNLAINPDAAPDPESSQKKKKKKKGGANAWDNPGIAALIVVAAAVVIGVGVSALTEDDGTEF